jgi:ferric-dicitrate binding protein FerR (iron transport regulator)
VAEALREHVAEGRLTMDEFQERLQQVYQSKTYGELARLTADLPDIDLHGLPARQEARPPEPKAASRGGMRAAWGAWAGVSAMNWAIWLVVCLTSGAFVYPWPIWITVIWGAGLVVGTVFGDDRRRR